jgi:hypothetical protein
MCAVNHIHEIFPILIFLLFCSNYEMSSWSRELDTVGVYDGIVQILLLLFPFKL